MADNRNVLNRLSFRETDNNTKDIDQVTINDITLTISPSDIIVDKRSYNYEWDTLRTEQNQHSRSGYSVVDIELSIIFKGQVDINEKLRPLIAGLRASPFCSVQSPYLERMLSTIESPNDNSINERYQGFKTIALAVSGIQISTMSHQGMPDCIYVSLKFIWFNYYPFTPIWSYKTGPTYQAPGYANQSALWKAFYKPFLSEGYLSWPHSNGNPPVTVIGYREFKTLPSGSSLGYDSAIDQLKTIQNNPPESVNIIKSIADSVTLTSGINRGNFSENIYKSMVRNKINANESLRNEIDNLQGGSLTNAGGMEFTSLIERISKFQSAHGSSATVSNIQNGDLKNQIDAAITSLVKKREELKKGKLGEESDEVIDEQYKLGKFNLSYKGTELGGFTLTSTDRLLFLHDGINSVIEQISISYSNTLSIIPMLGYRYPTCQHLGSSAIKVSMSINAENSFIEDIHKAYDVIDYMSLKFKQLPSAATNIEISNDFLNLFGLREFITDGLRTETIGEMPGRSRVTLDLTYAGLRSEMELKNPEDLTQEFVRGDESIYRDIWNIFKKFIREQGTKKGDKQKQSADNSWQRYKLEQYNISNNPGTLATTKLIDRARWNYNIFLEAVHKAIFDPTISSPMDTRSINNRVVSSGTSPLGSPSNQLNYNALMAVKEMDNEFGFVPGLKKIQESITKRIKTLGKEVSTTSNVLKTDKNFLDFRESIGRPVSIPEANTGRRYSNEELKKEKDLYKNSWAYTGDSPLPNPNIPNTADSAKELLSQEITAFRSRLHTIGLVEYQRIQSQLFQEILESYLDLDVFRPIAKKAESIGIGKGTATYNDFRKQIGSVVNLVEYSQTASDAQLIRYDPDCFMWYPIYDGTNFSSSIDNFVDPSIIQQSKELTKKSYLSGIQKTEDYFNKIYKGMFQQKSRARESISKSKYIGDIFGNGSTGLQKYPNSLNSIRDLSTSVFPDQEIRDLVTLTPKNTLLSCPNIIEHSRDIGELLGEGMIGGAGLPPKQGNPGYSHPNSSDLSKGSGKAVSIYKYEPNWSTRPSFVTNVKDNRTCPCDNYSNLLKLYIRPVSPFGNRSFWKHMKDVEAHWDKYASKLQGKTIDRGGGPVANPHEARKIVDKPLANWSVADWQKWKSAQKDSRSFGYLHTGYDFFCPLGTSVYSCADGIVSKINKKGLEGAGIYIEIKHTNIREFDLSRYLHLNEVRPDLTEGSQVKVGELIAISGASGCKNGAKHLHFETWKNGYRGQLIDPEGEGKVPMQKHEAAQRFTGFAKDKAKIAEAKGKSVDPNVTSTTLSPLGLAIDAFGEKIMRGYMQSLIRAYPAFKLYFIEDDSNERKLLGFDDFFSYSAVRSILFISDKEIAADLVEIELTNISGNLTNRKYQQDLQSEFKQGLPGQKARDSGGKVIKENTNPGATDTKKENSLASFVLQEGTQISLRLGYSNDPELLTTVFNGVIMETQMSEAEDLIKIIAQSYAIELVQDVKGATEVESKASGIISQHIGSWFGWGQNANTCRILEEMMCQPEVLHFGRWEYKTKQDTNYNRDLLTNKWRFVPEPQDDNIFAPTVESEEILMKSNWWSLNPLKWIPELRYAIYKTTIWDIFQEMTLRHPNYIACAVPYKGSYGQERMTMFYGLPNQLYFARDPNLSEQNAQESMKKEAKDLEKKVAAAASAKASNEGLTTRAVTKSLKALDSITSLVGIKYKTADAFWNSGREEESVSREKALSGLNQEQRVIVQGAIIQADPNKASETVNKMYQMKRLISAKQAGFIKPFRKYHLVTSEQHIISNNIRASSQDVANTITLQFNNSADPENTGHSNSITVKLDHGLQPQDMRTEVHQFVNAHNQPLAARYALSILMKHTKNIYRGDIQILGDPDIRPHDVVYLMDATNEMIGAFEVARVVHRFDVDNGFRTEIRPHMLSQVGEWALMSSAEALGMVAEGVFKNLIGSPITYKPDGLGTLSYLVGKSMDIAGFFLSEKLVNYTQFGFPIVMAPLTHHGRPFTGGVPIRRLPHSLWHSILGEWAHAEGDDNYREVLDDMYDNIAGWFKKWTFQSTVGDFRQGRDH